MEQSKIIDTLETYQASPSLIPARPQVGNDKNRIFDVECYLTYLSMLSLYCGKNIQIHKIQDKSLILT